MGHSIVLRFAGAATPEALFTGQWQNRRTALDPYKPYLHDRWQDGCTNAWQLWEEVKEQGYSHDYASVRDYIRSVLRGSPQPIGPRPPTARTVTRWILTHPDALPEPDQIQLKTVLAACPELDVLAAHVRSFARMLTQLEDHLLPEWIEAASTANLPALQSFARHLERDLDAVIAGLSLPWNSGVVEGHVNRIILWNQRCQAVCLCITSR